MKPSRSLSTVALLIALCTGIPSCAEKPDQTATAAIPYPLDTCIVSGEKLGADSSMKPYSFVYEGQEIQLCCKSCLKDFQKEPEKYLAKLKLPVAPTPPE